MKFNSERGIKSVSFYANELLQHDDMNFISEMSYHSYSEMAGLLAQSMHDPDIADNYNYIISGLQVKASGALQVQLYPGMAVSFTGSYYSLGSWGFSASPGDTFAVIVPIIADVGVSSVGGGFTDDRYDILEVRPVKQTYDSKSRQFRDPVTGVISTVLSNIKSEYTYEFAVKQGASPGGAANVALTTPGWIKLAEIRVDYLSNTITSVINTYNSNLWVGEPDSTVVPGTRLQVVNNNTAVGMSALSISTGCGNTAVGDGALQCSGASDCNTAFGTFALNKNTIGAANTAIGYGSMLCMETGRFNVALGSNAMAYRNTCRTIAIGSGALVGCTDPSCNTGHNNVAVGNVALRCVTSGECNLSLGSDSSNNLTTGGCNVAVGHNALSPLTIGICNVAVGVLAGGCGTCTQNGTFIGSSARTNALNSCYETVIGAGAIGCGSCTVTLGRASDRAYLSDGTCHKTFGTAQNCIPLNNGTVNTCLNADLLDGLHVDTSGNALASMCTSNTWSGVNSFNPSSGTVPFTVGSTRCGVVTCLNADMVDGKHVSTSGNAIPLLDGANTWSGVNTFNPTTGTVPFAICSSRCAVVTCFNADMLDGVHVGTSGDAVPKMCTANTWAGSQTFSLAVILSTQATCTCHAVAASRCISAGNGLSGGGNLIADRTICIPTSGVTAGAYGSTIASGYFCVNNMGIVTVAASCTIRDASLTQSGVVSTGTQSFCGAKTFAQAVILSTQATCTCHAVQAARCITAGTGLSGGGNMISDRTICIPTSGVTAGAYGSTIAAGYFCVNNMGIVTVAASCTIRDASLTQSGVVSTGTQSFCGAKTFAQAVILSTQATCTCHAVQAARCITAGCGLCCGGNLISDRTICLGTPSNVTSSSTNSAGTGTHSHALNNSGVTAGSYGSNIASGYFTVDAKGRITSAASCTIRNASSSVSGVVSTSAQSFCGKKCFCSGILVEGIPIKRGSGTSTTNIGIGVNALLCQVSTHGIGIGEGAARNANATGLIAIGGFAACALTGGINNVVIGYQAAREFSTGCCNVFIGAMAGCAATCPSNNVMIGANAGQMLNGCHNVVLGRDAMRWACCGLSNTVAGMGALCSLTSGNNNIALGVMSGTGCTTVSSVAFIGSASSSSNCINTIYSKATSITTYSDVDFKHDICEIHEGLDLLRHISPISYYWHSSKDRLCTEKLELGFGAQCINKVFCECLSSDTLKRLAHTIVVKSEDDNNKSLPQWAVNETNLIPFMVNAIKELDGRLSVLEARV